MPTLIPREKGEESWNVLDLPMSPATTDVPSWPNLPQLLELVQYYFAYFHTCLPCLHKASFIDRVVRQELQERAPVLLYAVISMAASRHPDPVVRACQHAWFVQAK
jgi:hypothetical protein